MDRRHIANPLPAGSGGAKIDSEQLDVLARLCHDAYYTCMHERYGSPWPRPHQSYHSGKYWRTGFVKLAELCAIEDWEPMSYIKAAFDHVGVAHHYIVPTYLLDKRIITRYKLELASGVSSCTPAADWKMCIRQLVEFVCGTGALGDEHAVLLTPMTPFPAWFRVLYPEKLEADMMGLWGSSAKTEFSRSADLRNFARVTRPDRFSELESTWGRFSDSKPRQGQEAQT